ncbi:GntR family transcriptional regulator [Primorskyibacter sp. 2E107]|uniref:GntR family transcriptional regulator n=1 Tax=Primorskyibacter sp. 2E107 TaxID=3403458 RepID=UPI003AF7F7A8
MQAPSLSKLDLPPHGVEASGAVSASQAAYEALRQRIIALDLPPGAVLSRNALARQLGVSQTPVREALQKLEQDGLIRIVPQSRTTVRRIDVKQLEETQFLRMAVESEVVSRLARGNYGDALKRPRALVQMQASLGNDIGQMELFDTLDRGFHRALFEAVGMVRVHAMLGRQLGHLARCQRLTLPREGKMADIVTAHTAILDGIAAGEEAVAVAAMREHLSGTIRQVPDLQKEFPDYFLPESD